MEIWYFLRSDHLNCEFNCLQARVEGKFESKRCFSLLTFSQVLSDVDKFFMIFGETSLCAISEFQRYLSYLIGNT